MPSIPRVYSTRQPVREHWRICCFPNFVFPCFKSVFDQISPSVCQPERVCLPVSVCLSVCLSLRWCVHKHDELAFMIKSYKYNRPKEEMTLECNTKLFKAAKVRLKHILHVYCYIYDTFINISHALTKGGFVDLLLIYLLYIASYQIIIKPYYPDFNNKLNPGEGSLKGALRLASSWSIKQKISTYCQSAQADNESILFCRCTKDLFHRVQLN